jgi:hypothetical protein
MPYVKNEEFVTCADCGRTHGKYHCPNKLQANKKSREIGRLK